MCSNELDLKHREVKALDDLSKSFSGISVPEFREKVLQLQNEMVSLEQVECPVNHHFSGDSYAREITLPAGSLVVGKIHRHAHVNVISKGECIVLTESGVKHLKAPLTFVSEPETKRIVYSVSEVVWTTIHVTKETDLVKIEEYVISPSYNDLDVGLLMEMTV